MNTANEHGQPDRPAHLQAALREQGEREEDIPSLLPTLEALEQWKSPVPSQVDTQRLVELLVSYLPVPGGRAAGRTLSPVRAAREQQMLSRGARLGWMLDVGVAQVGLLRPSFWIASVFLSLLGMLVLYYDASLHEATLLRALGPLFAVLGVSSVFRSVRLRTLEMELSCPISPMRLALIRLALVLGYDIGLGFAISLGLGTIRDPGPGSNVVTLMLHWLAPLLAVSGLALLLSLRLSAEVAAGLAYGLWLSVLAFSLIEEAPGRLRPLLESGEAVLALSGVALLALGILRSQAAVPRLLPRS
jgi:hypothetical protein